MTRGRRSGQTVVIAVHSTALGPASGGCRVRRYAEWPATGGVTAGSARELLDAGCVAVGLGSVHTDSGLGASVRERAATFRASIADRPR